MDPCIFTDIKRALVAAALFVNFLCPERSYLKSRAHAALRLAKPPRKYANAEYDGANQASDTLRREWVWVRVKNAFNTTGVGGIF